MEFTQIKTNYSSKVIGLVLDQRSLLQKWIRSCSFLHCFFFVLLKPWNCPELEILLLLSKQTLTHQMKNSSHKRSQCDCDCGVLCRCCDCHTAGSRSALSLMVSRRLVTCFKWMWWSDFSRPSSQILLRFLPFFFFFFWVCPSNIHINWLQLYKQLCCFNCQH